MQVTNRPNIFLDQGQFSNPDLSAAHIKGKMSNLQIKNISIFVTNNGSISLLVEY
jgi:hypothetical protein